jgi:hypothetical protein
MGEPPPRLDGADLVCGAVSRRGGFYLLAGTDPPVAVAGMAVARYADDGSVYLFKCDRGWRVVQDWDCGSVEEARGRVADHAGGEPRRWRERAGAGLVYREAAVRKGMHDYWVYAQAVGHERCRVVLHTVYPHAASPEYTDIVFDGVAVHHFEQQMVGRGPSPANVLFDAEAADPAVTLGQYADSRPAWRSGHGSRVHPSRGPNPVPYLRLAADTRLETRISLCGRRG